MKPIKFEEANADYAEHQAEYMTLPAHKTNDSEGMVTSCWQLSEEERNKVLSTGKIWLSIMSFNQPLQPQLLSVDKPDMETGDKQ